MGDAVIAEIGTCWWCGSPADSREHKFKRTDIERLFGRGPYRDGQTLEKHQFGLRPSDVSGSKSKVFKFQPTLCKHCNGVRSQPFDSAYDAFIDFLFTNEAEILESAAVDLRSVYGSEWQSRALDLARYFVKHIGCRLANVADRHVVHLDRSLHDFLDGGEYPMLLGLAPLLDMSVAELWRAMRLFDEDPEAHGSFLQQTGIGGVPTPRGVPLERPEGGMVIEWFGIYWRLADDEFIPNQLAGPEIELVVTDWTFGSELRRSCSQVSRAAAEGRLDPLSTSFGEALRLFGGPAAIAPLGEADGQMMRPTPSPLGLSRAA